MVRAAVRDLEASPLAVWSLDQKIFQSFAMSIATRGMDVIPFCLPAIVVSSFRIRSPIKDADTTDGWLSFCMYYGPEVTAELVRVWLERLGVQTLFIEPGSPWEDGYVESFNGRFRDELLDREFFYTLAEAKVLVERWGKRYVVENYEKYLATR